ncbi:MAG: hypothetical protein IIV61_04435 [Oscillospiraceae bacterium]|nr:hypothetical protein [Oscillospiraceae bacterium]
MIEPIFQFANLLKGLLKVKKASENVCFCFYFSKNRLLYDEVLSYLRKQKPQRRYDMGSILETVMLVCFGFSWPLNVIKAYRAKTAKGTSLPFILLIITGYIAGISAKLISGQINYVLIAYILNLAIVSLNVIVYFRNVSLDKKCLQETEA